MVSPRENVSIIALPSEHPPPPRTHSSLPGEVWSIARPRASYSRELQPYEILGSLGRSKSALLGIGPRLNSSLDAVDVTVIEYQVFFFQCLRRPEYEPGQYLGGEGE